MAALENKLYLTKRDLVSKSQKAIRHASERAYEVAGYVVKKQGNQIVKAFKDGTIEVLVQLSDHSNDLPLALD
jgi:uncharacterized protein GlcG (DUF336 family)